MKFIKMPKEKFQKFVRHFSNDSALYSDKARSLIKPIKAHVISKRYHKLNEPNVG